MSDDSSGKSSDEDIKNKKSKNNEDEDFEEAKKAKQKIVSPDEGEVKSEEN